MAVVYGKDTPKLGFGLMRLPKRGVVINVEKVKTMVDLFLEAGFTYFDTAWLGERDPQSACGALSQRFLYAGDQIERTGCSYRKSSEKAV